MQLSAATPTVAPLLGFTELATVQKQKVLYKSAVLRRAGMVGHRGRDSGPRATGATLAMFVMLALTGATRRTVDRAVERLWLSKCTNPRGRCRVTDAAIFGRALATLLEDRRLLCARLDRIESVEEFVAARIIWNDQLPSTFASATSADWQYEVARALGAGPVHITQIGVDRLQKIADLLAGDQQGTAP
jgi:hypothetical protein